MTVSYCYNIGEIEGNNNVAGIVGTVGQYMSLIEKCYNTGNIISKNSTAGGIVGSLGRSSQIKNCYNTGNVNGVTYVGGILGSSYKSSNKNGILTNCYNIGKVEGETYVSEILGKYSKTLTIINCMGKNEDIKTNFINESNNNIWKISEGENEGYPVLTEM